MNFKKFFFPFSIFLISTQAAKAQSPISFLWEPEISYTWSPSNKWSYNIKVTVLNSVVENGDQRLGIERSETSFFATRKLFGGKSLSGGYLFRLAEPFFDKDWGYEHRFMEQFAFITHLNDRRLAHRFRAEQRIRNSGFMNRFRYRLSYDLPLKGKQLDPGEKYLIVSNEVLFFVNNQENGFDNRIYTGIGWFFNSKRKLETGLQYRGENIGADMENAIHLITSYYINR